MIVSKTAKLKWSNRIKKHYMDKGYIYTKVNDDFDVAVDDLPVNSRAKIVVKCESCGAERNISYYFAAIGLPRGNLCKKCASIEAVSITNKTWLTKYGNFYDFCRKNLGNDFLDKYWSSKNNVDPRTLTKKSTSKIWIKCQCKEYHDEYETTCAKFSTGSRCPQCRWGTHPLDSLGHKLDETFGKGASNDRWSLKNTYSVFSVPPVSHKIAWFKCPSGTHDDYKQSITNATKSHYNCPLCSQEKGMSYLREKVEAYIASKYSISMLFESNCSLSPINSETGYKLRYDLEIVDYSLLIEVNGEQHYKSSSFGYGLSKKEREERLQSQVKRDAFKRDYAIAHGYSFLEIPYWTEKDESYKQLIDNAILAAKKAASA